MINKLSGWDDTIIAPATAAGAGALAILRLSGTDAIDIVNSLFPFKNLKVQPANTLHVGMLQYEKNDIDEVVVSLYHKPRSFTGEDVVEISCHGSLHIQEQILKACIQSGARAARAGEFTQRAFINGKMDLVQAEAVADLIASSGEAARKSALHNMKGGFSQELKNMREQLLQFASLVELELDFAEEDVAFADRTQLYKLVEKLKEETTQLLQSFRLGNVIRHGVSVAIIGKPNAGKSTLLNTLLNEERAIVSPIPGTTRDTIEEALNINGIAFRLIDTAGIREHSLDDIENIGIGKSREKMEQSDIILYIFDVSSETETDVEIERNKFKKLGKNFILVANKADLIAAQKILSGENILQVSAKQRLGIDELKEKLYSLAAGDEDLMGSHTIVTNTRHFEALENLSFSLDEIIAGMDAHLSSDLLSAHIRSGLFYLGEITGEITNEDKLDYIFSKFCIGK